jgi:hypothetical protein
MGHRAVWIWGVLALSAASSCGGGGGLGATCESAMACGGDIVGTWMITSSCLSANGSMFDMTCPNATVSSSNLSVSGTVTYAADMTYTATTSGSGTVVVGLPASCLVSQGITVTCSQLNQAFAADPTLAPPGTSCVDAPGGACDCSVQVTGTPSTETGTYTTTTAGGLTQTASGSTPEQDDYCVKGDTLTLSPQGGSLTMMGIAETGTITLTKQ